MFTSWHPQAPEVISRTKGEITLSWNLDQFAFLRDSLLYRLEKNNKLPQWIVVYSGSKTTKTIYNLPPSHPHKFRLKVLLKREAIPHLEHKAIEHYGDERAVYKAFENSIRIDKEVKSETTRNNGDRNKMSCDLSDFSDSKSESSCDYKPDEKDEVTKESGSGDVGVKNKSYENEIIVTENLEGLESQWSEQCLTSTNTDGTSAVCFCMAVKCGYLKQIQSMLDERPELIGIVNSYNSFTPLAIAVRKGDINTVKYLLFLGAEVDQQFAAGQTALHLAVMHGDINIVQLLLDKSADIQVRDVNGLRAEHYAVDSGDVEMVRIIFDVGGDVNVKDSNGWTPLFRALCQGAKTELIMELVLRGSSLETVDKAGLPLTSVARLLKNRNGVPRECVLRLVDTSYPHEKARLHFTRITKKINTIQQLLNFK